MFFYFLCAILFILQNYYKREMNLQKLQLENQDLKRKLARAQAWMKQEVTNQVNLI
ncbi:MAG: hypothetical protein ACPHY8_05935 [Patescibacteria group bacterium]